MKLADVLLGALRQAASPGRAEQEKRYLKSDRVHLGTSMPAIRRVAVAFHRANPELPREELLALCRDLWARGIHECNMLVVELCDLYQPRLLARDLALLERWLREARTWAISDSLAASVVGPLVERLPALQGTLDRWARDPDFWIRRASLLGLLLALREGRGDLALFGRRAEPMLGETEFFVRKAIGWVLRDTSRKRPEEVAAWLLPRAARASGLTVREATKHLPARVRAAILAAHQAGKVETRRAAAPRRPRARPGRAPAAGPRSRRGSAAARGRWPRRGALSLLSLSIVAVASVALADGPPAAGAPEVEAPAVVVHGGVGSLRARMDGTSAAAARGLAVLRGGGPALDAAIAAVVQLEDDCRFNAGTGANIRLDGKTVQMDAALMDGSTGRFAAVGAIERVRNPVLVARRVLETPHVLVVGEGATRLARLFGFPDHDPVCPESLARYERVKRILLGKETGPALQAWKRFDWRRFWNFPGPLPEELREAAGPSDTVGAVARDGKGGFAAAISTGGTTITFYGRVGDVPVLGAGIHAGPAGAVACTGQGEEIIRRLVSRSVYERLERGLAPQDAVEQALAAFPPDVDLGIVAVGRSGEGGGANWSAERKAFGGPYAGNMAWSVAR